MWFCSALLIIQITIIHLKSVQQKKSYNLHNKKDIFDQWAEERAKKPSVKYHTVQTNRLDFYNLNSVLQFF